MQSKTLSASGYITADGIRGELLGFEINGGAATDGRIDFRDGGASGTVLVSQGVNVNDSIPLMMLPKRVKFNSDIYAAFVGGVGTVNAFYESGGDQQSTNKEPVNQ